MRTLQSAANNRKCSAELSWGAASKMSGMYIDFPTFTQRFEADAQDAAAGVPGPKLQDIVDHYDESGIVLKTNQSISNPVTTHDEIESNFSKRSREAEKRVRKD